MRKLYALLSAHANAQCEFTTKGERFYGIGRAEFLSDKQIFLPPYAVKPLSFCGKLALCRSVYIIVHTIFDGVYTVQHVEYQ